MALFYADASAIVKLVLYEAESDALEAFVVGAEMVSCELALTEVPRAIHRAAADDRRLERDALLARTEETLGGFGLLPLDRDLLLTAGALAEPALRSLDAIHVAAALALSPLDAFLSYDERQSAVARLAGLRTVAPGVAS